MTTHKDGIFPWSVKSLNTNSETLSGSDPIEVTVEQLEEDAEADNHWDEGAIFTYDELATVTEEQWKAMHEDERYMRLKHCDPTLEEFVLSSIKPGEKVAINFQTNDFKVVKG